MNKIFHLKENGTTIRTEIGAGFTIFLTMAYIIALNPNILTNWNTGTALWNGVFLATCLASAIAMFVMGFWANKPFGLSSGMGLNSFFAIVVTNIVTATGVSYTQGYQAAMCIILIEGVVFLIISLLDKKQKIIHAIPAAIRTGIAPAIGLMLMNIGLGSNIGVYNEEGTCFYVLRDFFGALTANNIKTAMGDIAFTTMIVTVVSILVGIFIMCILHYKNIRSNILIGMGGASAVYWIGTFITTGINPFSSLLNANWMPPFNDMIETTLFKFDFQTFFSLGATTVALLIFTFCFIDYADSIGTMIGTAQAGGMVDKNGDLPGIQTALAADAVGTIAGSFAGTSTVTTYIESASGIKAGGRTGLTAITTGLLFLACIFISPIAAIIPGAATSAALIYVGILMLSGLSKLNWKDITVSLPVALMMIAMPISGSIGHGIGLALISHTVLMLFTKRAKEVSILTYILSALFLVKFFLVI